MKFWYHFPLCITDAVIELRGKNTAHVCCATIDDKKTDRGLGHESDLRIVFVDWVIRQGRGFVKG